MLASSRLDVLVGGLGNDSAKRLSVRGMAKTPYIFDLLLGKLNCLLNVNIRGEELDAWRIRGSAGGRDLG